MQYNWYEVHDFVLGVPVKYAGKLDLIAWVRKWLIQFQKVHRKIRIGKIK